MKLKLGDTAYIIYRGRRYKGIVEVIRWGDTERVGDPQEVWVLVPELDLQRPFHRPFNEVYRTSRAAKDVLLLA